MRAHKLCLLLFVWHSITTTTLACTNNTRSIVLLLEYCCCFGSFKEPSSRAMREFDRVRQREREERERETTREETFKCEFNSARGKNRRTSHAHIQQVSCKHARKKERKQSQASKQTSFSPLSTGLLLYHTHTQTNTNTHTHTHTHTPTVTLSVGHTLATLALSAPVGRYQSGSRPASRLADWL
jgi:hypothetical protein